MILHIFAAACIAGAQPPQDAGQNSQPPTQTEADQEERNREATRQRLQRRLAQIRDIEAQIEAAIAKLDEGASTDEIIFSMRPGVLEPDPRGPRPGPPPPDDANPLDTPERLNAFLEEHLPDLAAWMQRARERDEDWAARATERLQHQFGPIAAIEESDPVLFDLRLREHQIGYDILGHQRSYRDAVREKGADSEDAQAVKQTLTDALEARFDVKLQILLHEIETVQGRVDHLHAELAEMESDRSESIRRQLHFFTKERRRGPRRDRSPDGDRREGGDG